MGRPRNKYLRIVGWIFTGIVSLILLTTLVFYLGRNFFVNRALGYINGLQPGKVELTQAYLIPFIGFPDITLHLQEVRYLESESAGAGISPDPIISLEDIAVTLDLMRLVKGDIRVKEARLKDGYVHVEIYADSLSNLERALGLKFGGSPVKESNPSKSSPVIDMDKIELINIRARMDNRLEDEFVDIHINQLASSFSYHPDQIRSAVDLNIHINRVKYQTINSQIDKIVQLSGGISLDPETRVMKIDPSSLSLSGLAFETWGMLELGNTPRIDLAYSASNEGLELLNFILMGILDLNEIEQIGEGSIHLNGSVQGHMGGGELPVIRVNGEAADLGFRIKAVNRDVSGISFRLFASNGGKNDLSEASLELQDFEARFPEGKLYANLSASNVKLPQLDIEVDCDVNLDGLEEMIKNKQLSRLSGSMAIKGRMSGAVNLESGDFMNEEGALSTALENVSFFYARDSIRWDSIKHLTGALTVHDSIIEAQNLTLNYNGNPLELGLSSENLLLYLLGNHRDIRAGLRLSCERFLPGSLLGDTVLTGRMGEEIRDLNIQAGVQISKGQLDNFLKHDSVPELLVRLDTLGVSLPQLAPVSNVQGLLGFGPESISIDHLRGTIGESSFSLAGLLSNYDALSGGDPGEVVWADFTLSSDLLWAEDLFTLNGEFLLPEEFSGEFLQNFRISGSAEAPVAGLVHDSLSPDFRIDIHDLGWRFRYYPDPFREFLIQVSRVDDLLTIENVQGSIGENNLVLSASIENFTDTLMENMYGSIELYSDLLDFNQLLSYQLPEDEDQKTQKDSLEVRKPPELSGIAFPNFAFTVNIGELHYGKHTIFGMDGKLRTSKEKIIYLDQFITSPEGRGTLELNGQLNLTNSTQYVLSAEMNLEGIDINDLNLELEMGDSILTLKDHVHGIVDGRGLAEIFISPELKVDLPSSVAQFIVRIRDGALIDFTPLQAAGKFLDNKDLNNVRFDELMNTFTLIDSRLFIPRMNVESTIGQLLITGEQALDGSYLYLVRVPQKLARAAARSAMSEGSRDDGEDEVVQMRRGNFLGITLWSDGRESEFKLGDRRDRYKK